MNAVIGARIEIQHHVVHGHDAAGGVGDIERVCGLDREVQLGRARLAGVQGDKVGLGERSQVSKRPECAKRQLAFIQSPAVGIAKAGAARRITLILADSQDADAELGDPAGRDITAQRDGQTVVNGQLVFPIRPGLEVGLDGVRSVNQQPPSGSRSAQSEGVELARAIADILVGAECVDDWIVDQRCGGGQAYAVGTRGDAGPQRG